MSFPLSRHRIVAAAGLLVLAVILGRWTSSTAHGVTYTPEPLLEDVTYQNVFLPEAARVTDAHLRGSRLYVLDGLKQQVSVLDATSGDLVRQFGRQGGGPGELQRAMALAVSPVGDTIAVLDQPTLSFFTESGTFIDRRTVLLPCVSALATLAWTEAGIFVSGNCMASGTDTMQVRLWRLDDQRGATELAALPKYTIDGTWGTAFGWPRRMGETQNALLFGSGIDGCVLHVDGDGTREMCSPAEAQFSAEAPADFPAPMPGRPALKWPDPLPVMWHATMLEDQLVLLRPFHQDSMVARLIDPDGTGRDLFVASWDGFVTCRSDACIWSDDTMDGARIRILRVSDLSPALAALSSPPRPAGAR
ncbi:MAG: 6-bladed beta-propeller [Longimicrobiales bacterium]